MNRMLFSFRHAVAVLIAAATTVAIVIDGRADELVIPKESATVEGNGENGFPFHIGNWQIPSMRYQQIYGGSDWGGVVDPILITEIRFRQDGRFGSAFESVLPDVQINFSTTNFAVDQLSRTFSDNVGADDTVVFSGELALSSAVPPRDPEASTRPFDIVITLQTPFLYDPTAGNLLLDVRNYGGGKTTFFDLQSVHGDATSRGSTNAGGTVDSSIANFVRTGGLVTQFGFVPVVVPVAFDVLPGDDRNRIHLKSKGNGNSNDKGNGKGKSKSNGGLLMTAILTQGGYDAANADPATLLLGDPELDGAVPPASVALEDVDRDGDLDLVAEFSIEEMVDNGAVDGETLVLLISGRNVNRVRIEGADVVWVKP